ncbi:MAG: hypothetical protein CMB07_04890 [Euryarchaeota archaeon]|nr:hypothetical protein [Euryarchaeota archaeon]
MSDNKDGGPRRRSRSQRGPSKAKAKGQQNSEAVRRALERFEISPSPMGIPESIDPPPQKIEIDWPVNAVAKPIQKKTGDIVSRPGEFGFLPQERVDEISKQISDLDITLEQALSLRAALNQEKSVYSHGRLMRRSNELRRRYESGDSVLSLSKRFDAPPVNTFRAILTGRGWSKNKIKESLKSPKSRLKERDFEQFQLAEEADRVSSVNQSETQTAAEVFEQILCSYFSSIGVRFRKQEDLEVEQKRSEGRAIITPDLLLLDDVRINGIPCAWIDAKHFFGAALKFPRKKTQKQVDRYVSEYGQGAIVYRHGFCEALDLKGAILLDSSPLDLSDLDTFHENNRS